jgi:hypothetical protein
MNKKTGVIIVLLLTLTGMVVADWYSSITDVSIEVDVQTSFYRSDDNSTWVKCEDWKWEITDVLVAGDSGSETVYFKLNENFTGTCDVNVTVDDNEYIEVTWDAEAIISGGDFVLEPDHGTKFTVSYNVPFGVTAGVYYANVTVVPLV